MKCKECKTFKKADNCQTCYISEKQKNADITDIIDNIRELLDTYHLTTLDKIRDYIERNK